MPGGAPEGRPTSATTAAVQSSTRTGAATRHRMPRAARIAASANAAGEGPKARTGTPPGPPAHLTRARPAATGKRARDIAAVAAPSWTGSRAHPRSAGGTASVPRRRIAGGLTRTAETETAPKRAATMGAVARVAATDARAGVPSHVPRAPRPNPAYPGRRGSSPTRADTEAKESWKAGSHRAAGSRTRTTPAAMARTCQASAVRPAARARHTRVTAAAARRVGMENPASAA